VNERNKIFETHEIVIFANELPDHVVDEMCTRYFDQHAANYDKFDEEVDKRRLYTAAVDELVVTTLKRCININRILSFGCGTGRRERGIARALGYGGEIIGIERSRKMAAHAERRGLRVFDTMSREGALQHSLIDVALCLSSFVHLPNDVTRRTVLRYFAESLRPGGILILDVFNLDDKYEWGQKIVYRGGSDRPSGASVFYRRVDGSEISYMHYFTLAEICQLIEQAGFVIQMVYGVGYAHRPGVVGVPFDEGCLLLTCQNRVG
jgi:SAM-dependent methyltransferase